MKSKDSFYVAQSFVKTSNAAVKPRADFEDILKKEGVKNIGIKRHYCKNYRLVKLLNVLSVLSALICMPKKQIIFFQYPGQYALKYLLKRAKQRDNKVVFIIHDLNELRGMKTTVSWMIPEPDILIVHTENMKNWVETHYPGSRCVVLGIFDYLSNNNKNSNREVEPNHPDYSIVFAGNLSKSEFIYSLPDSDICSFHLYGNGIDSDRLPSYVNYHGSRSPEKIIDEYSKYSFGLVWDGDSIKECNGDFGEYLKYNSPYKASSYICGRLPLIVWKEMGLADFIDKNKIGIAVNSLEEIPELLTNLSVDRYAQMKKNINRIANKIEAGEYGAEAVKKSVSLLQ